MDARFVAASASLAMVLEVTAGPKPGNVSPSHPRYVGFVRSALACRPALEMAAQRPGRLGRWFRRAVEASVRAQPGGNTHFGTLLLLVPLAAGAGRARTPGQIRAEARRAVRRTGVEDGVEFYRAFRAAPVRVAPFRGPLDLRGPGAIAAVRRTRTTFCDAVALGAPRDRVAKEWTTGFSESGWTRSRLAAHRARQEWNEAVVRTYLDLLARRTDSLVDVKFGERVAREVQRRAARLRRAPLARVARWNGEMVRRGVNPGSTADVLAAGIFLWLVENRLP